MKKICVLAALIVAAMSGFHDLYAQSVGADGSLCYDIPIVVPSGTRGMTPKLSISYNSNDGNGMLGEGWSLNGIPRIIRDKRFAINYNSADHFTGENNNKLIKGTDGKYRYFEDTFSVITLEGTLNSGTEYWIETKRDGTKYYYGADNQSRCYVVGSTTNIRVWCLTKIEDAHGNAIVFSYIQSGGEYYPDRIVYTVGKNDWSLFHRYRTIAFTYDQKRADAAYDYSCGSRIVRAKRLVAIDVISDAAYSGVSGSLIDILADFLNIISGTRYRRYEIGYNRTDADNNGLPGTNLNMMHVTSVNIYGRTDDDLIDTHTFTWDNHNRSAVSFTPGTRTLLNKVSYIEQYSWEQKYNRNDNAFGTLATLSLDMDGDGKSELVHIYGGWSGSIQPAADIYKVTTAGCQMIKKGIVLRVSPGARYMPADVNGDGLTDIVSYDPPSEYESKVMNIFISNGSTFTLASAMNPGYTIKDFFPMDIDGDGKNEIGILKGGTYWTLNSYTFNNSALSLYSGSDLGEGKYEQIFIPSDFSGDNRKDVTQFWRDNIDCGIRNLVSDGSVISQSASRNIGGISGSIPLAAHFIPLDMNGDGLSDMFWYRDDPTHKKSRMLLSDGTGNTITADSVLLSKDTTDPDSTVFISTEWGASPIDFNGDGKCDMLSITGGCYLSNGTSFTLTHVPGYVTNDMRVYDAQHNSWSKAHRKYILSDNTGDYNGDGMGDFVLVVNETNGVYATPYISNSKGSYITGIAKKIGGSTEITYDFNTNKSNANVANAILPKGSTDYPSAYPRVVNNRPKKLVTKIVAHDGNSASYGTSYKYYNGMRYMDIPDERKDLYFEWIQSTNDQTKESVKTWYAHGTGSEKIAGEAVKSETRDGSGSLVSVIMRDLTSVATTYGTGTEWTRLDREQKEYYEGGTKVYTATSSYTDYDAYGRVQTITETASGVATSVTSIIYDTVSDDNNLDKILMISSWVGGELRSRNSFLYNSFSDPIQVNRYFSEENREIPVRIGYDEFGNVATVTDPFNFTTTIVYDNDYHAYPINIRNTLGHELTREYDPVSGQLVRMTDPNGFVARVEYDGQDRPVRAYRGSDLAEEIFYHDELVGQTASQYVESRTRDTSTLGYTYSRSYYDGLGRVLRTASKGFEYNSSTYEFHTDVTLDNAGRVSHATNRYIAGETPYLTTYNNRDARGRVTRVTQQTKEGSRTSTISYTADVAGNRVKVTTTDPRGVMSSHYIDALGRLAKRTEADGLAEETRIDYLFDQPGNTIQTIVNGTQTTTVKFDTLGRRVSINDPNRGLVSYTYNDNDQCLTTTDAKSQTIRYAYDALGRLELETRPGEIPIAYMYDGEGGTASQGCIGRLTRVNDGASITTYKYNTKGELVYQNQEIDSLNFRFNMEYDVLGRLTSLTYPDGQSVSNVYSDMGYLSAVLKGGTSSAFVQYGKDPGTISAANNVLGTVNSAYDRRAVRRTGNGIMTVIGYEPVTHHPTDVITQNVSATEGEMAGYIYEQTKYTYDLNDNVSKIAYAKYMNADDNSLTQEFAYDGLNRLITANGSYGTKTYEYNHFGNLTKKGDVTLTYGNASHPHAVTSTSAGKTYTYDVNGNMTNRNGQTLTYDSYDQLRKVETSGKPTEQYTYDHTGTRVKKTRSDGVIVYNIGGLYELAIVPGRSQMHTKYIMGWNGEMVAQSTRDDASLIGALAPNPIIDIRYSPNHTLKIIGEICWTIMRPDREFGIYGRYIPRGLIALGFILLVIGIYYRTVRRKDGGRCGNFASDLAPIVLCAFVAFSGTLSCGDILGPYNDMEYDDSGDDNYDTGTVDTTGFPEKGTYYFHPNQVGSAQFITDSAGRVTYKTAYTPYGEKIADKTEGKKVTHFGYTDQEEDDNTGLMYYGARYYDPEIARFIQADTMVPDPTSSQAFNRYMYCLGNPIRYNDPTGHQASEGGEGSNSSESSSDSEGNGSSPYGDYGPSYTGDPHSDGCYHGQEMTDEQTQEVIAKQEAKFGKHSITVTYDPNLPPPPKEDNTVGRGGGGHGSNAGHGEGHGVGDGVGDGTGNSTTATNSDPGTPSGASDVASICTSAGVLAAGAELGSKSLQNEGYTHVFTNGLPYRANFHGNGSVTRAFAIETAENVAKGVGKGFFVSCLVFDGYSLAKGRTSICAVAVNLAVGIVGIINPELGIYLTFLNVCLIQPILESLRNTIIPAETTLRESITPIPQNNSTIKGK